MTKLGYSTFDLAGLGVGRKRLALVVFLAIFLIGCTTLSGPASNDHFPQGGMDGIQASPVNDVGRGQDLFMGRLHLQNGGPPCMGCHNVDSNGILGGGALGPDLTNVSARRSTSNLMAILASPGPIMKPIFSEHPLTAGEQADLLAFLQASAGKPKTNRELWVIAISLAGLLAAAVLTQVVYRHRLLGVRKPFVERARSRKL